MKKLYLGETIKVVNGEGCCDFCKEYGKPMARTSTNYYTCDYELKWVNEGLFSMGNLVRIVTDEFKKMEKVFDICKDCAKQIAQQL